MRRLMITLVLAYGAAAAAAAALASAVGLAAAVAIFWIGGAVLAFAGAALAARLRGADRATVAPDAADRALAEALRRWEADRLDEPGAAASSDGRRRRG